MTAQSEPLNFEVLYAYLSAEGPTGEYEILFNGKGAGTLKPMEIVAYRDIHTQAVYFREFENFVKQMQIIPRG